MTYTKLDKKYARPVVSLVFFSVFLLALVNTANNLTLVSLWGVIGSIVCPLIVTVLPGSFFYYIMKE